MSSNKEYVLALVFHSSKLFQPAYSVGWVNVLLDPVEFCQHAKSTGYSRVGAKGGEQHV